MRHVYLHVPFCRRRCTYCDFSIAVRKRIPAREYVDAVVQELRQGLTDPGREPGDLGAGVTDPVGATDPGREVLETIYFGGGTPSLLPPGAVAELLTSLRDVFHLTSLRDDFEVTLEANPEDVTLETAAAWRRAGINRVSLGAQSFDDRVLQWMHRSHDAARIAAAVRTLRDTGVDNISLDLIFALPTMLERDWARDLEQAVALGPAHLSLYGLTVEERTPLARWISRGAAAPPDDDRYADEYLAARGLRLSVLRGLERRARRPPLASQLRLLVGTPISRPRPGGPLVRRCDATLESRRLGSVPSRRRLRPVSRRVPRSSDR